MFKFWRKAIINEAPHCGCCGCELVEDENWFDTDSDLCDDCMNAVLEEEEELYDDEDDD